jgi:hypothetical protein
MKQKETKKNKQIYNSKERLSKLQKWILQKLFEQNDYIHYELNGGTLL